MLFQITEGAFWSAEPAKWTGHPARAHRMGLSPLQCVVIIRLSVKEGGAVSKSKEVATEPQPLPACYKVLPCCGRSEPLDPETTLPGPQKNQTILHKAHFLPPHLSRVQDHTRLF